MMTVDGPTGYTYFPEAPDASTDSDRYTFASAGRRGRRAVDHRSGPPDTNTVITVGTTPEW
jgi:hypothetical protein